MKDRWKHLGALATYCLLSVTLVWQGASLTSQLSGFGSDPYDSPWFLAWWPYAVTHHLNPFFTKLVWYPIGVSLLWVTSIPLLAFLGWPLTASLGAPFTYNFYVLLAPILAAWFCYFVCLHITRSFLPSLLGGFLFGFSTYELAQNSAALNLSMIFCVPALLLVILRRLDNELSRVTAVFLAVLILLSQFLICIEIFAMIFVFGCIGWGLAYLYLPQRRLVLRRLVLDGLCAGPFILLPLVPLLLIMLSTFRLIHHPEAWPYFFVADPVNLIIPSRNNFFGSFFTSISDHFTGGMQEQDIYLGIPLLILLLFFSREESNVRRFLLICFLVFLLCSFGPMLWVAGHFTGIGMPWLLAVHLPLLSSALPTRFALFVSLIVAIIAAIWLARPSPYRAWRFTLGGLACLCLLPSPHPWRKLPVDDFFIPKNVQQELGKGARVLILPFGINGPSSFWQMQSNFNFTQVGGYLGFPPKPAQKFHAVGELFGNQMASNFLTDFVNYTKQAGAQYVLIAPGTDPKISAAVEQLPWSTQRFGDVVVLKVPPS